MSNSVWDSQSRISSRVRFATRLPRHQAGDPRRFAHRATQNGINRELPALTESGKSEVHGFPLDESVTGQGTQGNATPWRRGNYPWPDSSITPHYQWAHRTISPPDLMAYPRPPSFGKFALLRPYPSDTCRNVTWRLTLNQRATGSIPVRPTIFYGWRGCWGEKGCHGWQASWSRVLSFISSFCS